MAFGTTNGYAPESESMDELLGFYRRLIEEPLLSPILTVSKAN